MKPALIGGTAIALLVAGALFVTRTEPPASPVPQISAADQARIEKEQHQRNAAAGGALAAVSTFQAWRASRREKAAREEGR